MARPEPTVWGIAMWHFQRWGNVDSFDWITRSGIPGMETAIRANTQRFVQDFVANGEVFVPGGQARLKEGIDLDALAERLAIGNVENARAYLDAAVLIFAHSILSEVVTACCTLAERMDRNAVREAKRRIPSRRGEELSRQLAVLRDACPLGVSRVEMETYVFDAPRVGRLDRLRHDIVHGHVLGDPIALPEDDVQFLKLTGSYALNLVRAQHVGRIPPEHLGTPPVPLNVAGRSLAERTLMGTVDDH